MAESPVPDRKATTRPAERRGMSRTDIREEQRGRSRRRKGRRRILITAGALVFAVVFIGGLVLGGQNRNRVSNPQRSGLNTGGPVSIAKDEGAQHVPPGTPHAPYGSRPATSGPHWQTPPSTLAPYGAPARWGTYKEPLPDEVLVHNLEHGGIGLHYDCPDGCPDLVKQLADIVPSNPSQFILSPYTGMPKKVAVTAWRHLLYLDEVDREKILEFIREYLNRAPESVPGNQF